MESTLAGKVGSSVVMLRLETQKVHSAACKGEFVVGCGISAWSSLLTMGIFSIE